MEFNDDNPIKLPVRYDEKFMCIRDSSKGENELPDMIMEFNYFFFRERWGIIDEEDKAIRFNKARMSKVGHAIADAINKIYQ